MIRARIILIVLFTFPFLLNGQYQWQDPLDIGIGLADKTALLYNVGGLVISRWVGGKPRKPGVWETAFSFERHKAHGDTKNPAHLHIGRVRIGRQLYRWAEIGLEGQGHHSKLDGKRTYGLGGGIYFNWYLLNREHFRLFFDNGFGFVFSGREFPTGGTTFNFTRYYGLHVAFKISRNAFITFGGRSFHLSNAYLFGDDNNPAYDSTAFSLGLQIRLAGCAQEPGTRRGRPPLMRKRVIMFITD